MNDSDRPRQISEIPGVPPPPPTINTRRLWITLLAPSAAMVLVMAIMFSSQDVLGGGEALFTVTFALACIVCAVCWGFYIHTVSQRFHGTSLVLLILAYPILQGILLMAIFFTGCLAIVSFQGP